MPAIAPAAPAVDRRNSTPPSKTVAGTRKRVLVVDDDPFVLRALGGLIETLDADVDTATDPVEALRLLQAASYDLVIADERMPKMSGLDMLTRVRAACPRVPTILITGHADPASFVRAYERCGVFRYLTKPWDNVDLAGTVRSALRAAEALS